MRVMSLAEQLDDTPVPRWTLGERMAKARRAAGLNGAEMAERLSDALGKPISKQTISNWENDHTQPRNMLAVLDAWAAECPTEYTRRWLLTDGNGCSSTNPWSPVVFEGADFVQQEFRLGKRQLATVGG